MNILEITEEKIFKVLGKGRDPNYKPKKKTKPVAVEPFDFSRLLK